MKEKGEKESIHADHRQRMRERIAHGGIEGLSDHEVLEYLLYPFIPRKDTNVIAHELIERFSSLDGVAHATPAMLRQIKGITENAVLFLSCMTDIGDRCRKSRAFSVYFRDSFTVAQYAFELFGGVREERVYIVCLGGSAKTVASVLLARGDEIACDVPEELVLASVTGNKTKSAYLLHNHVGDSALPSHRDAEFTSCVKELLSGAGVTLNDHVIISDKSFYSFKFNGLL